MGKRGGLQAETIYDENRESKESSHIGDFIRRSISHKPGNLKIDNMFT